MHHTGSGRPAMHPHDAETTRCGTCNDEGKILHFYSRGPSSPPGNAFIGCPDCEKGRAYAAAIENEMKEISDAMQVATAAADPDTDILRDVLAAETAGTATPLEVRLGRALARIRSLYVIMEERHRETRAELGRSVTQHLSLAEDHRRLLDGITEIANRAGVDRGAQWARLRAQQALGDGGGILRHGLPVCPQPMPGPGGSPMQPDADR